MTRLLYDRFAWAYDLVVDRPAGPSAAQVAKLVDGRTIVDAGCGTGHHAAALAARGYDVVGVDGSEGLVEQARGRKTTARFEHADLLAWQPDAPVDAVLCRGVLNDLVDDDERAAAIDALASWLRPGGTLIADVRDWAATAARYDGGHPPYERAIARGADRLTFTSTTTLDHDRRLMHLDERFAGLVGGEQVDERHTWVNRPWSADEVEAHADGAGLVDLRIAGGTVAGIREDRLLVTARANGGRRRAASP